MKLIVGLGNPGKEYENTFHNLGFRAAKALAETLGVTIGKEECFALTGKLTVKGEKILIALPQTYMNLSGKAVRTLLNYYKIPTEDLLVIYDDFDLPAGEVRIRAAGSAGTHNGMRNVVEELGTTAFKRIRIGFHADTEKTLIDYVLSPVPESIKAVLDAAVSRAAKAAEAFAEGENFEGVCRDYGGGEKPNGK